MLAIRRWLDDIIIGYNFCPYARPTDEAQQVRIVTSSSSSPEGVLEDLSMEAVRLPTVAQKEIDPGQPATTLLVCPHVLEWESFDEFRAFYDTELSNGYIFAEQDLYIVCFHPSYGRGWGLSADFGRSRFRVYGLQQATASVSLVHVFS